LAFSRLYDRARHFGDLKANTGPQGQTIEDHSSSRANAKPPIVHPYHTSYSNRTNSARVQPFRVLEMLPLLRTENEWEKYRDKDVHNDWYHEDVI